MFDRILFPTDGSDEAFTVFAHVLDVARAHDSTVHVLHVADTGEHSVVRIEGDVVDVQEREGIRIVDEATARADDRGVDAVGEVVRGDPYRTIVAYADEHEMDLVVMPTHGRRGLDRFLLGSTTERVVRRSDVPVLTVRPEDDARHPYRTVLVPTDGSDHARAALDVAVDVVESDGAALHLLTVVRGDRDVPDDGPGPAESEGDGATAVLEAAASVARNAGVDPVDTTVTSGRSIPESILGYVDDHGVDLVVVGTRGRTGLDRYVLGSVAERLVRTAPVPVLTVRGAAGDG